MKLLFKKILVPIDGSENSDKATNVAIEIAKTLKGEITFLHAYSVTTQPVLLPEPTVVGTPTVPILTSAEITRVSEATRGTGERILLEGEKKASKEGVQAKRILVDGHAVQEIVKAAKEGEFDLIVVGARGISHIREMFLGSVTDGVIHHASCPVLVIK